MVENAANSRVQRTPPAATHASNDRNVYIRCTRRPASGSARGTRLGGRFRRQPRWRQSQARSITRSGKRRVGTRSDQSQKQLIDRFFAKRAVEHAPDRVDLATEDELALQHITRDQAWIGSEHGIRHGSQQA